MSKGDYSDQMRTDPEGTRSRFRELAARVKAQREAREKAKADAAASVAGHDGQKAGEEKIPSLAAKLEQDFAGVTQPRDESQEASVKPYPKLGEAAYYGVFGRTVEKIAPHTEADPAAILVQTMTMFGCKAGAKAHFRVEATDHYANLSHAWWGNRRVPGKGVLLTMSGRRFPLIDPDWVTNHMATGLHSGEGLIWNVRDPIFENRENKQTGGLERVMTDSGVDDKRLCVIEPEFAQPLKLMSNPRNILSTVLRCAWDHKQLRTMVKNDPNIATGAHIAIIGHITEEELKREIGQCELFNGFANRFLWLYVKRSKVLAEGGLMDDATLKGIAFDLKASLSKALAVGRMHRDPEASALWKKVYPVLTSDGVGMSGVVTNRAEAQVLRMEMHYALQDGSSLIKKVHLQAALALWQYCFESARYVFGDRLADINAQKILEALKACSGGMTRTEIWEQVFNRNINGTAFELALSTLETLGLSIKRSEGTAGRTAERWFYKEKS